ncbi:hypothetical protein NEDG_00559 [Nematocida displodere]|uniref:CHY-type domain-containing protein n=1 Tax=Nematocida displodere TaxID=1805483 RepID=A0A177ECH0_9MICR|nr:hypothetical protein NEDG_00559 [Nematocida displodere]
MKKGGGVWVDQGNGIVTCTYAISGEGSSCGISEVSFKYNYNRDSLSAQGVSNKLVCDAIAIGYLRARERMGHERYCQVVFSQIEKVLGGAEIEMPPEETEEKEGRVLLDIAPTHPTPTERFIEFRYVPENIRIMKANCVKVSFQCKRCSAPQALEIGDRAATQSTATIQKNTSSLFNCAKCSIQLKIDTTFHLLVVEGANQNNLMRLETYGLTNFQVREVLLNVMCDICGELSTLAPGTKKRCVCGYLLTLRPGAAHTFKEVQPMGKTDRKKREGGIEHLFADEGRCEHYKKSTRIFIFPCCGGRYPCDVCHDLQEDHEAVYANRMICGKCREESSISPSCLNPSCKASLVGHTSHFWEGGKGTRDRTTMSKKDNKKYKK